jgi:hypothetical protein
MSVVESGNTASAAHYNNLRTRVINAASDFGIDLATIEVYLGTTMPAKTAGESISNEDYDKLFLIVYWLRVHQTGSADVGLPSQANNSQWNAGDAILAGDGYAYGTPGVPTPTGAGATSTGNNDLEESILEAENTIGAHAANQFSLTNSTSGSSADTSTSTWGGGTDDSPAGGGVGDELAGDNSRGMIQRNFSIDFSSAAARESFFKLGGEATFYVRMTNSNGVPLTSNPGGAKANWWYRHLNVDNPISFKCTNSIFSTLSNSYQQIFEKTDSNNSLYAMNRTRLLMRKNAANTSIDVRVRCYDYDRSISSWPDAPRDEDVGRRVATYVSLKRITAGTNPLFNTVGKNPTISGTSWTTNAITDQPALAVGPDPFSASFSSEGTPGTTVKNVGTFNVPADRWTITLDSAFTASGFVSGWLLGSSKGSSGNCRIIIRDGSYSGTIVYDTGILLPLGFSVRGTTETGLIFKTNSNSRTYYVQFESTEAGGQTTMSLSVDGYYNGPA